MADLTRADELVQTIERDDAFRSEVEAASTMTAKRQVLDAHGFQDISLDDMRAYVESKGGALTVPEGAQELSDDELAAIAGGLSTGDEITVALSLMVPLAIAAAAA